MLSWQLQVRDRVQEGEKDGGGVALHSFCSTSATTLKQLAAEGSGRPPPLGGMVSRPHVTAAAAGSTHALRLKVPSSSSRLSHWARRQSTQLSVPLAILALST